MKTSLKLLFLTLFAFNINVSAQGKSWDEVVTWSFEVRNDDDCNATIIATAKLIPHWHIFSVDHDLEKADYTGMPTSFKFKSNDNYSLVGKLYDGAKPMKHTDELGESVYFENKAVFKQKIKINSEDDFKITFDYEFQVCDENGCLFPPAQETEVKIKGCKSDVPVDESTDNEMTIAGDFATNKEGKEFVMYKNEWVPVPEGNSATFYKFYLELTGKNENN